MALVYVGGTSGTGTSTGYTVSLNGTLTGGVASSPAAGDIVVVFSGFGNTAASAPAVSGNSSGAYAFIPGTTSYHQNDTWDTEFAGRYAVMGSTPDTTLTVTRVTNAAYGGATVVMVWRGQSTTDPFDVTTTVAGAGNASRPNPPAITPITAGAWILAGGTGMQTTAGAAFTTSSNMTGPSVSTFSNGTTSDCGSCIAAHEWTSGAFTPDAVTGGTTSTSGSWRAMTLALRPEPVTTTGTLDASESGADTFAASGTVADPAITGSLVVSETGSDTFASTGTVLVKGALVVSESGADTFAATGDVFVSGALAVAEGSDTFAASGTVANQEATGTLAVTESGADTFASTGDVIVQGSLSVSETGQDTFASAGDVVVQGSLAVTEANDTFLGGGGAVTTGSLDATEGSDTFSGSGIATIQPIEGALSASEAADGFSAAGLVLVAGSMLVTESGEDVFASNPPASGPTPPQKSHEVIVNGGVYVRRGVKVLKFRTVEEAQAFLSAEEAANEPQTPKNVRKLKQKAKKRAYTVAQPEIIRLDAIQQAIERFQLPVELPKLETQQDWMEFVRIALIVQQMEDDEEDAIEMLLLA